MMYLEEFADERIELNNTIIRLIEESETPIRRNLIKVIRAMNYLLSKDPKNLYRIILNPEDFCREVLN